MNVMLIYAYEFYDVILLLWSLKRYRNSNNYQIVMFKRINDKIFSEDRQVLVLAINGVIIGIIVVSLLAFSYHLIAHEYDFC